MKIRFLPLLIFLILSIGVVFFILGKDSFQLKHFHEAETKRIVHLEKENSDVQQSLVVLEKENLDLLKEIEALKKNELENKEKSISSEEKNANDLDVQKETKSEKQQESKKKCKIAYLTFDDGPSKNTEKILEILREKHVKATFFVNGHPSKKDLYKQIVKEGHVIGNHTYSHNYAKIYSSVDGFFEDMNQLNNFLEQVIGKRPTIIRFPGGSNNTISHRYGGNGIMNNIVKRVVENGYQYFDGNVSGKDATKRIQNKDVIIRSVLEGAKRKKKAVILLHDLDPKTTTVEALPAIIDGLREEGFVFDELDENAYPPHFLTVF